MDVDMDRLNQFIGKMLGDLGGAASVPMVRMGDALGLYRTLHARGPMTCGELAKEAKVHERYLREWLSHQAASDYLAHDPGSGRFSLPPEQAMVFAVEDTPPRYARMNGGRTASAKSARGSTKRTATISRLSIRKSGSDRRRNSKTRTFLDKYS